MLLLAIPNYQYCDPLVVFLLAGGSRQCHDLLVVASNVVGNMIAHKLPFRTDNQGHKPWTSACVARSCTMPWSSGGHKNKLLATR